MQKAAHILVYFKTKQIKNQTLIENKNEYQFIFKQNRRAQFNGRVLLENRLNVDRRFN